MQKRWFINKKYPEKFAREFPEFSPIVLQLLWDRNIKTQQQVDEFFNPDYEQDLHDPYLMKDMERAAERIFNALENDEKILVYGDYDVDGVTSTAIMVSALIEIKSALNGIEKEKAKKYIAVYIPDRELEGYGLNKKAIKEIKNRKTDLIITVDCGTSSFKNVQLVNELGMDIIVTDHHYAPEKLPKALAIVNPRQKDCEYPFKELAGAGVAFKVAQALIRKLETKLSGAAKSKHNNKSKNPKSQIPNPKLPPGFEKWLLDLVALGTIADCVNLTGENRTLAIYGLLVINKTKRVGLKKLISASGLKTRENGNVVKRKTVDATVISYVLAPRLNAAGRMDHANTSYELIATESEEEAEKLAVKLENNNQKRQRMTEKMIDEIKNRVKNYKILPKIIIESDPQWKVGIVGLVAGKLADEYSRPFLVLQKREKETVGSGRSIPEFNLIKSIESCKDLLLEFGGHSQAAGLKIENKNLEKFKKKINLIADKILKEEDLTPSIGIDRKISPDEINWQLVDEMEKMKPFGNGNEKPVFLVEKLEVHEIRAVGNGDSHLKLCFKVVLKDGKVKYLNAIGFGFGKLAENMPLDKPGLRWGDIVDVVFHLEINEWNGNRELQMNVLDLKINK